MFQQWKEREEVPFLERQRNRERRRTEGSNELLREGDDKSGKGKERSNVKEQKTGTEQQNSVISKRAWVQERTVKRGRHVTNGK